MKVSELRHMKVFPSKKLSIMGRQNQPVEVTVADDKFYKEKNWWKYEEYLDIKFGRNLSLFNLCAGCGKCCKNILKRNIRMYMSKDEVRKIETKYIIPRSKFIEGIIKVDGASFWVISTKENGDCIFLTKDGKCFIHEHKPLWCKLWVCEKMQKRAVENAK